MALLTLTDVAKRFGPITAVDNVSFSVDRGEVVGFLGPNGAGKSTTMRMITQYLEPDQGQVLLDGQPVGELGRSAKQRIGYLPENNPLYGDMLVADYLAFIADLRGLAGSERTRAFEDAVPATGIASVFYRPIGELSKGYRQRVGLAQAILHRPDLLVLDEPTEGLDPNQRAEIRRLITELGKERTVLLSTHVLSEVEHTCARLLIINRGRVVADGPVEALVRRAQGAAQIYVEVEGDGVLDGLRGVRGVAAVEPATTSNGRIGATLTVAGDSDVRPDVFRLASSRGWTLYELHQTTGSLEALFRELTVGAKPEESQA
ncbi:MAG TPA: ATP-binding cassette domain-containing protein [Gemmatimonadales bacterium]|nr:ATP-binding cassette domain-containing protein [Gemmatimonadales bacterium]